MRNDLPIIGLVKHCLNPNSESYKICFWTKSRSSLKIQTCHFPASMCRLFFGLVLVYLLKYTYLLAQNQFLGLAIKERGHFLVLIFVWHHCSSFSELAEIDPIFPVLQKFNQNLDKCPTFADTHFAVQWKQKPGEWKLYVDFLQLHFVCISHFSSGKLAGVVPV